MGKVIGLIPQLFIEKCVGPVCRILPFTDVTKLLFVLYMHGWRVITETRSVLGNPANPFLEIVADVI